MSDVKAELARVKAEREKIAQIRESKDEESELVDQLEAEKRGLIEDQAIMKAEEEFGPVGKKIAVVDTDLGRVIVKRPGHILFKRFQDSGEATTVEFEKLVRPCVVFPKERLDQILEEQPAVLSRLASAVCVLAGAKLKEFSGK